MIGKSPSLTACPVSFWSLIAEVHAQKAPMPSPTTRAGSPLER